MKRTWANVADGKRNLDLELCDWARGGPMVSTRWRVVVSCIAVLLLAGCRAQSDGFKPVVDAAPPDVRSLGLPTNDAGQLIIMATESLQLVVDPTKRNPVHTMRGCRYWLAACRRQNQNNLDLCFAHAPPCKSARPWEVDEQCCPEACADRYREHRALGKAPMDADITTFAEGTCFPRMAEYRRGEKP